MGFKLETIKKLDFMAPSVALSIDGSPSYQTFTGVALSAAYGALIIIIIVQNIITYSDTTNPSNQGLSYTIADYPRINLVENKLVPIFVGYSDETTLIPIDQLPKYFTFRVQKVTWLTSDASGSPITQKLINMIDVIPCSSLSDESLKVFEYMGTNSFYYSVMMQNGMCPNITGANFTVSGKGSDNDFETVNFQVYPCTLVNTSECASATQMSIANFQILNPNSNFNASNYNNPHSFILNADDVYYINTYIDQKYTSKIREVAVMDSKGLFSSFQKTLTYFEIDSSTTTSGHRGASGISCTSAQITNNDPNCPAYFEFNFQSSGRVVVNKRSYMTIGTFFANIGGINTVIFVVITTLAHFLLKNKIHQYLAQTTFTLFVDKKSATDQTVDGEEPKSKGRFLRIKCCKKKVAPNSKVPENEKYALENIYESLDVKHIAKNANLLNILCKFLMEERHLMLAQVVGLNHWAQDKKIRDENEEKHEQSMIARKLNIWQKMNERAKYKLKADRISYVKYMDYFSNLDNKELGDGPKKTESDLRMLMDFEFRKHFKMETIKFRQRLSKPFILQNNIAASLEFAFKKEDNADWKLKDNEQPEVKSSEKRIGTTVEAFAKHENGDESNVDKKDKVKVIAARNRIESYNESFSGIMPQELESSFHFQNNNDEKKKPITTPPDSDSESRHEVDEIKKQPLSPKK